MDQAKLQEIKTAEKQADKIIEDGKTEYAKIVNESGEEGIALLDKAKQKVKDEYKQLVSKYRSEGGKEADDILSKLDAQTKTIADSSSKGKKKAIEFLINELKVRYGSN